MSISVSPLTADLGIQLHGANLAALSMDDKAQIRELFDRHHLIFVRDADLSEDQHIALAEVIGPISSADAIMKDGRKFTHVSNVHADGRVPNGELLFHVDHMFLDIPLRAISLYALHAPSKGGETLFIDAQAAYRTLPEELKRTVSQLQARHVYDYGANRGDLRAGARELSRNVDTAVHPIVWRHPKTGSPILFVSRLHTVEILGMPPEEGSALLQVLFDHLEARRSDYSHAWAVGDLVIWDNCVLQHARNDFDPKERRALRRVPIA